MSSQRPRVVVIGAGFGGIAVAKGLRNVAVDVTIIDRNNYHLFQPLLYQVATGVLDPSEIAHPIRSIVRRARNVEVVLGKVVSCDLDARVVRTDVGEIGYDYLVIAAGSTNNFFGNPALEAAAVQLKGLDDALRLRSHLLLALERADRVPPADRGGLLTFVIVGAGPTGIELAGAFSELVSHVLPKDYPRLDPAAVRLIVVERGDHVLDAFVPRLRRGAERALRRKGVTFRFGRLVTDVGSGVVRLDSGEEIAAGTVIWTAGVQGAEITTMVAADPAPQRRIPVSPMLTVSGHPEVFAIGDVAAVRDGSAYLPMLAPVAIQQGEHVARTVAARLTGGVDAPFRYHDKGIMATVGRNFAVAQIGRLHIGGFVGWLMWLFVHLLYIVSFRSRLVVLINWGWNYIFFDRPIRLIRQADDRDPEQPLPGHHNSGVDSATDSATTSRRR